MMHGHTNIKNGTDSLHCNVGTKLSLYSA